MGVDAVGSGVILAIAALLWLGYLIPTWLRRHEYLSTERNALRLQQTLRVMAESAELPAQVRTEASARSAAAQARLLAKQQRHAAAARRLQDAAIARAAFSRPDVAAGLAARRVRRVCRGRMLASLVLLVALTGVGFGVFMLVTSAAWMLLAASTVVVVASFSALGRLARPRRVTLPAAAPVARPVARPVAAPVVEAAPEWTPVPLPKPLYLSRPQASRAVESSLAAAAALREDAARAEATQRAAALAADAARRAAEAEPEVVPFRVPSRYAAMGVVDPAAVGTPDVAAALRRRRA